MTPDAAPPATDPSPKALTDRCRKLVDDWRRSGESHAILASRLLPAFVDAFRREGVERAYKNCLQLADDMTNQRALIRSLMKEAGVEKFKRTTKCLVCGKNPREEDGGMLCQSCRGRVDSGATQ